MRLQRTGAPILAAGATYLVLVAFLLSWWFVPAYRDLDPQVNSAPAWYSGTGVFFLWATSGLIGALLVALGAGIVGGLCGSRLMLSLIGAVILTLWLALWSTSSHQPVLFGVGGGLITASFIFSAHLWAKSRPRLSGKRETAADLRMAGHALFFISAWGLCGLLGAPVYAIRPQLMQQFQSSSGVPDMAVKVLVCLVLGWVFIAVSQYFDSEATLVA